MGKKIILAENAGFCFGVQRAVDLSLNNSEENNNIYTLGPLIHNNDVVNKLKKNHIYEADVNEVSKLTPGTKVILRSHGVEKSVISDLQEQKLDIVDATCPYVTNIHKKVEKYYNNGYAIAIVGDANHPEVIGINGWCDNSAIITKDGSDFDEIENFPKKLCIVCQTTNKLSNFEKAVEEATRLTKELVVFNTICSATEVRQKNAEELSKQVDVMIVIGGRHSSNTNKLYEICKKNCENTILIENSSEIPDNIISCNENISIGITAGASTPDWVIKEAINKMNNDNELTMNDVLNQMDSAESVRVGSKVKGKVISINDKEAYLDINNKAEAFLPVTEVSLPENTSLDQYLKVGDEVEVKIIKLKNDDGYVVVSLLELQRELIVKELSDAFQNKTVINVKVVEVVKGGVICLFKNAARVFLPASQIELNHVDDLSIYVGKELEVNVIEYEKKNRLSKIVVSRRVLLENKKSQEEAKVFETIKVGDIVEGEVKRITDFGAFIEIQGVDGLAHISELSWGKVSKITDVLSIGQKVKVVVLSVDAESKKLSLSIKRTTNDPWLNVEEKYPVGSVVLGKVVRFTSFGAFVELEVGIDGLIHISQISEKRISKPDEVLTLGEEVKAKIIVVDAAKKRIELSIKEVDYML
ncbi:bifunctional 4-hydroxy-3-methylbut-2-enyl diphosphate reductase/30S ribosomal protein S1 [Clostridium bornimense]|uniref:bifunctional 4-hydroxy-3-methylbut-2-enyl diphosphate reductase/30S ribosomal protein S1 n=1 Tax=Clostridium bornimense TaxID=1216932 RepID=UPI001C11FC5A|nr:bifunctional 4-hydroxy-3-methylbut-2-enyl diphosphate reductase/30S ribosomal protein S1 [Clostridium bornimense]MBU5316841.1 bifunctional 4-hydroxy-3-methylbut-2-enyl diphosphate reductase/30S ribosomal protein S1 [Clostridium bornimense]